MDEINRVQEAEQRFEGVYLWQFVATCHLKSYEPYGLAGVVFIGL